jgi:hypothetical protein
MSRIPTAMSSASVGVRRGPSNNEELQRKEAGASDGALPLNSC